MFFFNFILLVVFLVFFLVFYFVTLVIFLVFYFLTVFFNLLVFKASVIKDFCFFLFCFSLSLWFFFWLSFFFSGFVVFVFFIFFFCFLVPVGLEFYGHSSSLFISILALGFWVSFVVLSLVDSGVFILFFFCFIFLFFKFFNWGLKFVNLFNLFFFSMVLLIILGSWFLGPQAFSWFLVVFDDFLVLVGAGDDLLSPSSFYLSEGLGIFFFFFLCFKVFLLLPLELQINLIFFFFFILGGLGFSRFFKNRFLILGLLWVWSLFLFVFFFYFFSFFFLGYSLEFIQSDIFYYFADFFCFSFWGFFLGLLVLALHWFFDFRPLVFFLFMPFFCLGVRYLVSFHLGGGGAGMLVFSFGFFEVYGMVPPSTSISAHLALPDVPFRGGSPTGSGESFYTAWGSHQDLGKLTGTMTSQAVGFNTSTQELAFLSRGPVGSSTVTFRNPFSEEASHFCLKLAAGTCCVSIIFFGGIFLVWALKGFS